MAHVHAADRAIALFSTPVPDDDVAALDAFRAVYVDPVPVNGVATPLVDLVARARMIQAALADLRFEVLERRDTADRSSFAFRIHGRHVGPLGTPAGEAAPTGAELTIAAMDILELGDDRVQAVWAINDVFTPLAQAGAIQLR